MESSIYTQDDIASPLQNRQQSIISSPSPPLASQQQFSSLQGPKSDLDDSQGRSTPTQGRSTPQTQPIISSPNTDRVASSFKDSPQPQKSLVEPTEYSPVPSNLGIDTEKANKNALTSATSEENIYDSTPRQIPSEISPEATGEAYPKKQISPEVTGETYVKKEGEQPSEAKEEPKPRPTTRDQGVQSEEMENVVELEDTEEARKRAIRLASQEEKIFYEPEDDVPTMSATAFPGEMWNPFGEPGYADFKDD